MLAFASTHNEQRVRAAAALLDFAQTSSLAMATARSCVSSEALSRVRDESRQNATGYSAAR